MTIFRNARFTPRLVSAVTVSLLAVTGTACSPVGGNASSPLPRQPPAEGATPSTGASWLSFNELGPGGSTEQNAGVPTVLDQAVWLPVGSGLTRVDAEGNQLPTRTDLVRVDPATGTFTARVPLSGMGTATFALGYSIVVKTPAGADVISTKTLRRERKLPGGSAYAFGSIWDIRHGTLMRIDPKSGRVTGRLILRDARARVADDPLLAVGAGSVWVPLQNSPTIVRIDPRAMRRVASINLSPVGTDDETVVLGFAYGNLWANQAAGRRKLYRIDPRTNRVTSIVVVGDPTVNGLSGAGATNMGFGEGSVWTCDSSGTLTRVQATTTRVQEILELPFANCGWLGVAARSVWISNYIDSIEDPQTIRVQP